MNQDQVKEKLLDIEDAPVDFSLVFSGKSSAKVNGLYKPDSREIIIHNRNFVSRNGDNQANMDNLLMYTAIHEYAHHLHACAHGGTLPARAHSAEFWALLHRILEKAEEKDIYHSIFDSSPELAALTETIQIKYLAENGALVKGLGKQLIAAQELCGKIGGRFDDYIDRILRIPRVAAAAAIKISQYDINPAVGADNMRFLAGIRNDEKRAAAESALLNGKTPDAVKMAARAKKAAEEENERVRLEKEKARLERTISSLQKRLDEVEQELSAPEAH